MKDEHDFNRRTKEGKGIHSSQGDEYHKSRDVNLLNVVWDPNILECSDSNITCTVFPASIGSLWKQKGCVATGLYQGVGEERGLKAGSRVRLGLAWYMEPLSFRTGSVPTR